MRTAEHILSALTAKVEAAGELSVVRVGPQRLGEKTASFLHRFGVIAPYRLRAVSPEHWHVEVCPEVIASQAAGLPSGECEIYVEALSMWTLTLRAHLATDMALTDAERSTEESIYRSAPALLHIMSDVQLRALDSGA